MSKRIGVFVMALASLGVMLPASAAAAERGRDESRVVVQNRADRGRADVRVAENYRVDDHARTHVDERQVIVKRAPVPYYSTAQRCR